MTQRTPRGTGTVAKPAHAFDAHFRVLECRSCGAPATLLFNEGQFQCGYCQAINVYAPPSPPPVPEKQANEGLPIDEGALEKMAAQLKRPERIAWVHAEVQRPHSAALDCTVSAPAEFADYAMHANFNTWMNVRLPRLREAWQAATPAEGEALSPTQWQRIYWLAMMLSRAHAVEAHMVVDAEKKNGARLKRRAVLETALQHLRGTPFAAVVHCRLSRAAALAGDIASARAWLSHCPAEPGEVEVDGEQRLAFTTIYARNDDTTGILDLVGREGEEVPFWIDELSVTAAVYRIHAYELLRDNAARLRLLRRAIMQFERGMVLGALNVEKVAPRTIAHIWRGIVVPRLVLFVVLVAGIVGALMLW